MGAAVPAGGTTGPGQEGWPGRPLRFARRAAPFTIAEDGDDFEKQWWSQWTAAHFPSYETFWVARAVPLTYRVKKRSNVHFQTTAELAASGYDDEDVAIAQLHYTLLRQLGRVFELADDAAVTPFLRDAFFESFARLSGASDLADELLQRRATPGSYDAWDERAGSRARREWRNSHPDPLRPIRAYRNRLVHGRVVPEVFVTVRDEQGADLGQLLFYPVLGKVDAYLDWRVAFAAVAQPIPSPDFAPAASIVRDAWSQVVAYVEQAWQTHLLRNL